jgi:hypothetical protein
MAPPALVSDPAAGRCRRRSRHGKRRRHRYDLVGVAGARPHRGCCLGLAERLAGAAQRPGLGGRPAPHPAWRATHPVGSRSRVSSLGRHRGHDPPCTGARLRPEDSPPGSGRPSRTHRLFGRAHRLDGPLHCLGGRPGAPAATAIRAVHRPDRRLGSAPSHHAADRDRSPAEASRGIAVVQAAQFVTDKRWRSRSPFAHA